MDTQSWLDLAEAAQILKIHPSTLRRWADEGKVAHIRTLSGRRRFERAVIERARSEMQPALSPSASEQIESRTRNIAEMHASELSSLQGGWMERLTEEQRLIFRYSGQRLLGLMMQYISRSDHADTFLEEAKRIARDYGVIFHRVGLSVSQAAEAFLFFRRSILASVHATAGLGGRDDQEGPRVLLRTSDFFDSLLVAAIDSYAQMT